ncbi:MAG: c-type cytochrome [Sedimenticola sp.]
MSNITVKVILCGVLLASAAAAWSGEELGPLSQYKPELSDEFTQLLKDADIKAGEKTFMRKCSSCHDYKKGGGHGKGPHLWNLFGRKAGTISGFEFSEAMLGSNHEWNYATLNYYLSNTERAVPGRSMNFRGIRRDKQRANLIAFLKQFNDSPPYLPN